ncbi:hypothetical protein BDY19DRAFT_991788 [Irpex rosettiformis]|uniref:Uncharacterized protein n=1 Tax=Irpex rosettiformis TaxID=378272 RepID=A0ACB8UA37_9APHY|nr:hypothetical protein BDY19DRAFT_991788 [Irpex rosettiformis]
MSTLPPAAAKAAQAALELAVGPLLVTLCLAFMLYGVFMAQLYFYYTHYENDGVRLWSFVGVIGILETVHSALCIHVLYDYFVTHYGNPTEGIFKIVWSAPITVILEILIVTLTTSFYIRRIWYLSEKNILAIVAPILLLCARDAMSLVTLTLLYKYGIWSVFRSHADANRIVEATFSLGLVADVAITGTLMYYLGFNRSGFAVTNKKLHTLVHYTASTGALTVIISAVIVGSVKLETSLLFGGLIEIISKLYANSMLAMLNARNKIRNERGPERSSAAYEFTTSIRSEPYQSEYLRDPRARYDTPSESAYTTTACGIPGYDRASTGAEDALSDVTKMGEYKASLDKQSFQPLSPLPV